VPWILATFFHVVEFRIISQKTAVPLAAWLALPVGIVVRLVLAAGMAEWLMRHPPVEEKLQPALGRLWSSVFVIIIELIVVLSVLANQ
jgi:hypothetical protein